ncbi:MAG: AzlC family ABC transporter permease [Pseudomonadota bacterium]
MTRTSLKTNFLRGIRDGAPFVLVIGPLGMLFGVIGTEAGLNLAQVMSFTFFVAAGASQIAAISVLQDNAPVLIVLATALAVNLRMAMYSAALMPYLGGAPIWKRALAAYFLFDPTYALSQLEYEKNPNTSVNMKLAYYAGTAALSTPAWYVMTLAGALIGGKLPHSMALDFALPITFLAVVAPALKTLAHLAAAVTSVVLALALSWLPYSSGLLVAAGFAMAAGAATEIAMEKRA